MLHVYILQNKQLILKLHNTDTIILYKWCIVQWWDNEYKILLVTWCFHIECITVLIKVCCYCDFVSIANFFESWCLWVNPSNVIVIISCSCNSSPNNFKLPLLPGYIYPKIIHYYKSLIVRYLSNWTVNQTVVVS